MVSWIRRVPVLCLVLALSLSAEVRSLTILHSNDLHARLLPLENGNGGFAYLATLLKQQRDGCTDCLYLNAGDLVQGTPVSTIFHGMPVYEIANLLGIDAATLGNHEFDYGWPQTQKFLAAAKYPIVSANVVNAEGKLMTAKPYVILHVNGLRVAVIGGIMDGLRRVSTPEALGPWHPLPLIETVRRYAEELRPQSDLIVLLVHVYGPDEEQLLKALTDVPVIVSGHVHTGLDPARTFDGRVLVRVKGYGEELGRLDLKVDTEKKAPVEWHWTKLVVDSKALQPDPKVQREVDKWEREVTARVDRPLARSAHAFDVTAVKALIERAIREETGVDFAFMNKGGVRDILPAGQLRERHIWNIMPFDNRVLVGTFKGSQIPAIVAAGRQLDPNRDYTFAVSDFTAANLNNDGLHAAGLEFPNDVGLMRDILMDWFRKKKVIE